ncbi:mitogen-activated protein kinase kinase kinase 20-like [Lycium barbarum]|uniref:mitogen-activated protein kinase kinase kinase 20-like n=1 Tax=Lycium barbarum TaxID=112863 RepID=UPI00293F0393|nr:mitogen-activated protein kinase kinase kinase 20-like [Lycium barbarum]
MAEVLWKRGRILGKGGFDFVSLASTTTFNFYDDQTLDDVHLPPLIAVKSCMLSHSQSFQDEREFPKLFQDSPYVIRCFGVSMTEEDQLFLYNLLLEYASGESLADCLKNNYSGKGLPEFEVRKHAKNVLLGLSQVHGRGIIHCDIKPHNILLVGNDEVAKIADFGLALTLEQSWNGNHGLRGTRRYMAPESVLHHEYGQEVDIWAVGCTVYELLTGTPLWKSNEDDAKADVLDRIASEEPNLENEKLSREAIDFLRSCLVKNPCSRWTADMLLKHPFLNLSKLVDQPAKKRKKQSYMSLLRRPHHKTAFKTQPHIRDLIIEH